MPLHGSRTVSFASDTRVPIEAGDILRIFDTAYMVNGVSFEPTPGARPVNSGVACQCFFRALTLIGFRCALRQHGALYTSVA